MRGSMLLQSNLTRKKNIARSRPNLWALSGPEPLQLVDRQDISHKSSGSFDRLLHNLVVEARLVQVLHCVRILLGEHTFLEVGGPYLERPLVKIN